MSEAALQTVTTLLQLTLDAQEVDEYSALSFIAVNDSYKLIHYKRALFWRRTKTGIKIEGISGVSTIERNSPYLIWIARLIDHLSADQLQKVMPIESTHVVEKIAADWDKWEKGSQVLSVPLLNHNRECIGGLWLEREGEWHDTEYDLLERLADGYAAVLHRINLEKDRRSRFNLIASLRHRPLRNIVLVLIFAALFLPVRLSVLAKAYILPQQPHIISPATNGVVRSIAVAPNTVVKKGELLFTLEETDIRNQVAIAEKAVKVAVADLKLAYRSGFSKRELLGKSRTMEKQVDKKRAELAYLMELSELTHITSPISGVVLFNDVNEWRGRPVKIGERVMSVADPTKVEVELQIPVDQAIPLAENAEALVFLDIDPMHPLHARVYRHAYEGVVTPDGTVVFTLRARLDADADIPRIGLHGTSKIYGEPVSLFYFLFRRPLLFIRQTFGI